MTAKSAMRLAHIFAGILLVAGAIVVQMQSSGRREVQDVLEPIRNTLLIAGVATIVGPFLSRSTGWSLLLATISFLVVAFMFMLVTSSWFPSQGEWARFWLDPSLAVFALFLGAAARPEN